LARFIKLVSIMAPIRANPDIRPVGCMDATVETGETGATLYRSGPTSIAVTIPLRWARARGLKPGDRVTLLLGRNLVLVPFGDSPTAPGAA